LIQVDKNDLIGTEEKEPGKGIILSALDGKIYSVIIIGHF